MTDDKREIMLIGTQLQQRRLYGAAQLIFQLARERDEARNERDEAMAIADIKPDANKSLAPRAHKSLLPNSLEEMARAMNLMNNDDYD